jgi:polyhydroxyalkanoate synthase subunit PhaE
MSEPLDVGQWARNWEAMARQAQASFAGSAGQSGWSGAQSPANPWMDGMAKANPFASGKQQGEAMEHLLAGAQGYLGMLQSLANAAAGQAADGLVNPFASGFPAGGFSPSAMNNPLAAAMRSFGNQGTRGFEQMMDQFTAAAGPMLDQAKAGLHMPAFGHLREKQENLQKTAQVFLDYQEKSSRYDRLMLKVSEQAFARFQLKLAEREEPGRQIDSVRGLYDLWIDAAEEAYAEIALSEEFREVYAGVVDAQMRVRQQVHAEIEKTCIELGMPTRSEVNSIGERLQAMRREFRESREGADDHVQLHAEVAALRREVAALKASAVPDSKLEKTANLKRTSSKSKARVEKSASIETPPMIEATEKDGSVAKKARRKSISKTAKTRRSKRGKSPAGKSAGSAATVSTPSSRKEKKADGSSSFAASIAQFARKSKAASTQTKSGKKSRVAKRGGNK